MAQVSFRANVGQVRGLKFTNDGKAMFRFSAAENHSRYNRQTQSYDDIGTTWYEITVFGKHAEDLANVIESGKKQQVTVSGKMATREYTTEAGAPGKSLDVTADHVGLVYFAPKDQAQQQGGQSSANSQGAWGNAPGNAWGGGFQQPQQGEAPF
ncbi:MAG: single-stranded DNA-binding protein [Micrococcaceae bacterium]|nr:single-stranded DNA-binding protein [Micrococcaceae bacterium]